MISAKPHSLISDLDSAIKTDMGPTLTKLFAQMHVMRPLDPKSFMAAYLMHLYNNEQAVKEKMRLFQGN